MIFLLAFIGGVLLNFMPCTLPVLSLKAVTLRDDNHWFAAGMLSVFFIIAAMAAFCGFAWGQQLGNEPFVIGLAAVTFAAGLSFLGVWELPSFGVRDQSSSFGKGFLAALLSSGCSGPLLGPVFAATLKQPPMETFTLFMLVGLGMTTPYFFLPWLRRFVPKPGEWLVTFQKVAGFAMLGTVVWLLSALANPIPALIVLLGIGLLCVFQNVTSLIVATSIMATILIHKPANHIAFHPGFLGGDRVTIVEFSAPLCLTCDLNSLILDSIDLSDVQVLHADVSKDSEAARLLNELGYDSVPVLGIFRGTEPVVVLPDLITASKVLAGIETASR